MFAHRPLSTPFQSHDHEAIGSNYGLMPMPDDRTQTGGNAPQGDFTTQHASHDHADIGGYHEVTIGDHVFTTGELNALADYTKNPEDLAHLSEHDVERARELMVKEPLTAEEAAELNRIFPNYEDLSKANGNHFGESDDKLCEDSGGGGPTNRSEIETRMNQALVTASMGGQTQDPDKLDQALAEVAFAGHFIADAFSSGHLFNKADVQAKAAAALAGMSWEDSAEMVKRSAGRIHSEGAGTLANWRCEVMGPFGVGVTTSVTAAHLAGLLGYVTVADSPNFTNAMVLATHDQLSTEGVWVTDGETPWKMFGDEHLDEISRMKASALIESCYQAVHEAFNTGAMVSPGGIMARLPVPTEDGEAQVKRAIDAACDTEGGGMTDALVHSSVALLDAILSTANDTMGGKGLRFFRVGESEPEEHGTTFAEASSPWHSQEHAHSEAQAIG